MAGIGPKSDHPFEQDGEYRSCEPRWRRCEKTKLFTVKIGVLLVMAPTLLAITALLWTETVREATALSGEDLVAEISDRGRGLSEKAFEAILTKHNRFKPRFKLWRNLVAEHAGAFARLVNSFPNGKDLKTEHLRQVFSDPQGSAHQTTGREVFAPWTGRWYGTWSNGVPQYHIWKAAYVRDGQWIQPVSLSEYGFTGFHRVEQELQNGRADIAINVFSRDMGVTGWVSKWQNGREEMPHIGYLVNDTTLVWFSQIKSPDELYTTDQRWFLFLETVNRGTTPKEYQIYGVCLVVEKTGAVTVEHAGKHCGTYRSFTDHDPITQTKEADHGSQQE